MKRKKLIVVGLLSSIIFAIQCLLQEKLTQASVKITTLRQQIKDGKNIHGTIKCLFLPKNIIACSSILKK